MWGSACREWLLLHPTHEKSPPRESICILQSAMPTFAHAFAGSTRAARVWHSHEMGAVKILQPNADVREGLLPVEKESVLAQRRHVAEHALLQRPRLLSICLLVLAAYEIRQNPLTDVSEGWNARQQASAADLHTKACKSLH